MSEKESVYMTYGGDEKYDCSGRNAIVALIVLWFLYTNVYVPHQKACARRDAFTMSQGDSVYTERYLAPNPNQPTSAYALVKNIYPGKRTSYMNSPSV